MWIWFVNMLPHIFILPHVQWLCSAPGLCDVTACRPTPTYTVVMVQKVWCKSDFMQAGIEFTCAQLHMCIKGSPTEVQALTPWNWLATAWWCHCLCYCSSAVFHDLHLIILSFPQWKAWYTFQECYSFNSLIFCNSTN